MPEPQPGQIYRTPDGQPMLYVRTEQRPGGDVPEHLFVTASRRMTYQRWTPSVPPEFELVIDAEGRRQANEERWLRLAAEHDKEILTGLLARACRWLPQERVRELRAAWRDRQPPEES